MTFNSTTPKILLFAVLSSIASCTGQANTDQTADQNSPSSLGQIVAELDHSIWVIFQDRKNNYWFGSNGQGAFYYDGQHLRQFTEKDGLLSNQIRGIQEDGAGQIFFDTPLGISKFDGTSFELLRPMKPTVNGWSLQPGDLWFKGNGEVDGAYRYDGTSLYLLEFSAFESEAFSYKKNTPFSPYGVYSIYKDHRGNIWFGTLSAGVGRYDGVSLSWIQEKELLALEDGRVPGVRSIIEDKDGNFWFSNMLHRYNISANSSPRQDDNFLEYEQLNGMESSDGQLQFQFPYYNSAVTDHEAGDLWMATYNEGVWRYDGEKLTNDRIKDGQTKVLLLSIYKDKQGTLWLGTDNAGVYQFNGTTFEPFEL